MSYVYKYIYIYVYISLYKYIFTRHILALNTLCTHQQINVYFYVCIYMCIFIYTRDVRDENIFSRKKI